MEVMTGVWNNRTENDQVIKLSPKMPCEKAVNEKIINGFGVSITHNAYMGRQGKGGGCKSETYLELVLSKLLSKGSPGFQGYF